MTTEKQFAACAKLDGWTFAIGNPETALGLAFKERHEYDHTPVWVRELPNYNSRDVLIPLILKCDKALIVDVEVVRKHGLKSALEASTEQLREEFLRAEGKWIE